MPKSKEFVDSSDDSSGSEDNKSKKKSKRPSSDDAGTTSKKSKKETKEDEEPIWDLGSNRQVTVRQWKGKLYVDIREMYYDKSGELKPGKKGICLTMEQWRKFKNVIEEVDSAAKAKC